MIKTARFRIKDKNKGKILEQMARDVNFTWNVLKKWVVLLGTIRDAGL
jgi:hypothetical protein